MPEFDAPTRAAATHTRAGCFPSSYSRFFPSSSAQFRFCLSGRPRLLAGPESPHRHTIDLSAKARSEEHTSELQSLMRISYAVFCLKKKTQTTNHITIETNSPSQQTNN